MKNKKLIDAVLNNKLNYKKLAKNAYKKSSIKSKLLVSTLLASTLAVGATAASFDKHGHEHKEGHEPKYNMEFEGDALSIPSGYEGEWKIGEITVIVDKNTILEFEDRGFKVGDEVEVYAIRDNNEIKAIKIEQEDDDWF